MVCNRYSARNIKDSVVIHIISSCYYSGVPFGSKIIKSETNIYITNIFCLPDWKTTLLVNKC